MSNKEIITQTRREADLLGNGILALIKQADEAICALNGNCEKAAIEIADYRRELIELLDKIGSLEKESDE